MSITVLNYLDQSLVDSINAQAAERAAAAEAAAHAARLAEANDFATALKDALQSYSSSGSTTSASGCTDELNAYFEEASATYGVPVKLLLAIASVESGFNSSAVSSAGAVGIMQLMPETAAGLGVSNSYDARENILGGAKLMAQLLDKYNGSTTLALAAYNAGSGNVDKYGGIPPFEETQNYVIKVISSLSA